jgi:tetratricopeptide (TPR) repeat protein
LRRAYGLRNRVSRRDEFNIEASYYSLVEGNVGKSVSIYKQWLHNYPRDRTALMGFGSLDDLSGESSEATSLFREAIRLDPDDIDAYSGLIYALMGTDNVEGALKTYDEAKIHKIEIANIADERFHIAFLQHDSAEIQRLSRTHVDDALSRTLLLAARARAEEYYGRYRNARELWDQAMDYPKRHDLPWKLWSLSVRGLSEAVAGNAEVALPLARQALTQSRSRTDRGRAALSLALAGDDKSAENEARILNREFPADTILQNFWLPTTRAVVELHRNEPAAAIRELERDSRYEQFGSLLPSYVRGEAYLRQHQPANAIAEFKKVLAHPNWTNEWAFGAIAHLQLARAQVVMGDKATARKSYQDFLVLWKDADPDIPIYKQAKAEYAHLQ